MQTYILAKAQLEQPFIDDGRFVVIQNGRYYTVPTDRVALRTFNTNHKGNKIINKENIPLVGEGYSLDDDNIPKTLVGQKRDGGRVVITNSQHYPLNALELNWSGVVKVPVGLLTPLEGRLE